MGEIERKRGREKEVERERKCRYGAVKEPIKVIWIGKTLHPRACIEQTSKDTSSARKEIKCRVGVAKVQIKETGQCKNLQSCACVQETTVEATHGKASEGGRVGKRVSKGEPRQYTRDGKLHQGGSSYQIGSTKESKVNLIGVIPGRRRQGFLSLVGVSPGPIKLVDRLVLASPHGARGVTPRRITGRVSRPGVETATRAR